MGWNENCIASTMKGKLPNYSAAPMWPLTVIATVSKLWIQLQQSWITSICLSSTPYDNQGRMVISSHSRPPLCVNSFCYRETSKYTYTIPILKVNYPWQQNVMTWWLRLKPSIVFYIYVHRVLAVETVTATWHGACGMSGPHPGHADQTRNP